MTKEPGKTNHENPAVVAPLPRWKKQLAQRRGNYRFELIENPLAELQSNILRGAGFIYYSDVQANKSIIRNLI